MSEDPDSLSALSIVIPHYGDPAMTDALVDRLHAQQTSRFIQVIVADDCSPNPYPDRVGVDLVRLPINRGFGTAVNRGAEAAVHPLLMVLNSDVVPETDFVDSFVAAVMPHMPCVASPDLIENGHRGGTASNEFPSAGVQTRDAMMPVVAWRRRRRARTSRPPSTTAWVAGACMLLKTSDFRRVAGFDEGFYMYGEDIDLCRRLLDIGTPAFHAEAVDLVHAHGGSSDAARVNAWAAAAKFRYARKWGFRSRLGAGLAAASAVNLVYNALRRVVGKDVRPLERLRYEWSMLAYGWKGIDPRDVSPSN